MQSKTESDRGKETDTDRKAQTDRDWDSTNEGPGTGTESADSNCRFKPCCNEGLRGGAMWRKEDRKREIESQSDRDRQRQTEGERQTLTERNRQIGRDQGKTQRQTLAQSP